MDVKFVSKEYHQKPVENFFITLKKKNNKEWLKDSKDPNSDYVEKAKALDIKRETADD